MNCPICEAEMLKRGINGFDDWQYECIKCLLAFFPQLGVWYYVDKSGKPLKDGSDDTAR